VEPIDPKISTTHSNQTNTYNKNSSIKTKQKSNTRVKKKRPKGDLAGTPVLTSLGKNKRLARLSRSVARGEGGGGDPKLGMHSITRANLNCGLQGSKGSSNGGRGSGGVVMGRSHPFPVAEFDKIRKAKKRRGVPAVPWEKGGLC